MNIHLQAAIDLSQAAANLFDRAGGDVSERMKELYLRNGRDNIQLSLAAAAIAQAESAERQAVAMERIDRQLARIATVLNELTSPKLEAPDWDEDGDE